MVDHFTKFVDPVSVSQEGCCKCALWSRLSSIGEVHQNAFSFTSRTDFSHQGQEFVNEERQKDSPAVFPWLFEQFNAEQYGALVCKIFLASSYRRQHCVAHSHPLGAL